MSSTINLYPAMIHNGNTDDAFGDRVDNICNEIHVATKGFGTNENRLLKALGSCTTEDRCAVPARYNQMFGKNLVDVIEKECGNRPFGKALQYFSVDPVHAECEMLEDACKGFGTNEVFLFSIICGRSNSEIALLKKKYADVKGRNLERQLCLETTGTIDNLVRWCLEEAEVEYDRNVHTEQKMEEDAEHLRSMGEGKWGTNERGLFKILCTSPPRYLQGLNSKYEEKYGHDLVKALEKEMSGISERATMFLLGMKLNPYEQIAKMIRDACALFGTNELLLTSYLVRYQGILDKVNDAHVEMYKKSLKDRVKGETGGDYEQFLVAILESSNA